MNVLRLNSFVWNSRNTDNSNVLNDRGMRSLGGAAADSLQAATSFLSDSDSSSFNSAITADLSDVALAELIVSHIYQCLSRARWKQLAKNFLALVDEVSCGKPPLLER